MKVKHPWNKHREERQGDEINSPNEEAATSGDVEDKVMTKCIKQ